MNHLRLLFALSAALNVGFGTLLVLQIASSPGSRPEASRPGHGFADLELFSGAEADAGDAGSTAPATSQGYRRLFAALRATGLPEAEILRIVRGTAMADWQDDVRRLHQEAGEEEFWAWPDESDLQTRREKIELRRAREAALAELLGDDEAVDLTTDFFFEGSWSDLSPGQQRRVRMLEEDYALLLAEIRARGEDLQLAEDVEALRLLQEERSQDLAAILSPTELEEYELRHSEASRRLRDDLRFFEPTEEEFRDIFHLRQRLEAMSPGTRAGSVQPGQVEEDVPEILRELLGAQRFADYRRATHPGFQHLAGIARRLDLPMERALRIHNFRALIEEQYHSVLNNSELAPEDRREAIALLAEEARQMVRDGLGEKGYQAYTENGGSWLHDLEEQAAEPAEALPAESVEDEET